MKLTDIKKLKVTELRSRLKEAGLDTRGLKSELVDRLWSVVKPGEEPEVKLQHDSSSTASAATDKVQVRAPSSPPTQAGVTEPCRAACAREFADMATQTDPGRTTSRGGSGADPEPVRANQAEDLGGDDRALLSEEMGRGRAFYEFKEEIRYKR